MLDANLFVTNVFDLTTRTCGLSVYGLLSFDQLVQLHTSIHSLPVVVLTAFW
jgi:hypothetical protein